MGSKGEKGIASPSDKVERGDSQHKGDAGVDVIEARKEGVEKQKGAQAQAKTDRQSGDVSGEKSALHKGAERFMLTDEKADQRKKDVKALVDTFEEAREKKDLTGVFDEISQKRKEMSDEDFKAYMKEANKALHKAGLLPKGVDIDIDGVMQNTQDVADDGTATPSNLTDLPVKTSDGSHIASYDKDGTESFLSGSDTSVAHIPDLFDSRKEQRQEDKVDVAKEIAALGEINFKDIDQDGDNRITKKELDRYIEDQKKEYEKSKNPDELFRLKILEDMRNNFGKIQRASNDDTSGILGIEQGISPEDLKAYAAKMEGKFGETPKGSPDKAPDAAKASGDAAAGKPSDYTAEQREKDVDKLVDKFEAAREKKDLTGVFDEISQKRKELSDDDFKAYMKEANKELHKAGLLPKGVDIDTDSVLRQTQDVDDDGNVTPRDLTNLPVQTSDGSHTASYAKDGTEAFLSGSDVSVAHIPDLFDSRREQRKEEKVDVAKEIKALGEANFKSIDKDGDNRITKKELDDYIEDQKKEYEQSKDPDELFRLKILEDMRDNFGKIQRASNDDRGGLFGAEKGISPEDLAAYAERMQERHGEQPAEPKDAPAESKPEAKPEASSALPAEPADASKKGKTSLLDKRSTSIIDPFQKAPESMWVESKAGDTVYDYAYAAIRKAKGDNYSPTKEELATEVSAIAKANGVDPKDVAKPLPKGEDLNIPIPKASDK